MTFRTGEHSWAFLPESEYDPNDITLSHYQANSVVLAESETQYRCLEWIGGLLPELDTWAVFQTADDAAGFLARH